MLNSQNTRAFGKVLTAATFGLSLLVISSTAFAQSAGGGGGGAGGSEGGSGEVSSMFQIANPPSNNVPPISIPSFFDIQPRLEPCRTLKTNDQCR